MEDKVNYGTKEVLIVGIDPDIKESGWAVVNKQQKKVTDVTRLPFFELTDAMELLVEVASMANKTVHFVIEAGHLTKGNYHLTEGESKKMASNMGERIGASKQVGRLLVEFCKKNKLNYIEKLPLAKCWQGPKKKITQWEIEQVMTDFPKVSNQEERDAALLAWTHAKLPIRLTATKPVKK